MHGCSLVDLRRIDCGMEGTRELAVTERVDRILSRK
jgi:hypothetical protein